MIAEKKGHENKKSENTVIVVNNKAVFEFMKHGAKTVKD